jgi:WD40 repeat protein
VRIRNRSPSLLVTGGWDGKVRVFGARSFRSLAILHFHTKGIRCVEVDERNNLIVTASNDGTIAAWSLY